MPAFTAYIDNMKRRHTTQHTIRGMPPRVDEALRRKARQEGMSLNRTAIAALAQGLGVADERRVHHDLDDLAGTWVEDPAFDKAIESMDQVDPELWK